MIGVTASRAIASSRVRLNDDCAGTPLHTAWIARSDGWSPASARCSARSWTAVEPTCVSARTAAPTAIPIAATTARPALWRSLLRAYRTGTSARSRAVARWAGAVSWAAVVAVSTCGMVAGDVTGDKRLLVSAVPVRWVALLSVLTTNQKGAIAELTIARAAVELGVGVNAPYGDERCDLIFDLRPRLVRV